MFKWNNSLKPFQEKHFQKGQVHLKLAIIYVGVQPFAHNSSRSCFFLEKKNVACVCQNWFLGQKQPNPWLHRRFIIKSSLCHLRNATLSVLLAFGQSLLWTWRRSCQGPYRLLRLRRIQNKVKKRQRIVGLDWSPGLCC